MYKISLIFFTFILLNSCASADKHASSISNANKKSSDETYQSAEQLRELEIDDLIRSLEQRINAKELNSKEMYEMLEEEDSEKNSKGTSEKPKEESHCEPANVFVDQKTGYRVNPNPRDRSSLIDQGIPKNQTTKASTQDAVEARARLDKRKISDGNEDLDELKKEAYGLMTERGLSESGVRNQLSEFDKDEQYYRTLLRLQNLYRMYNKGFLEDELPADERSSRHCAHDLLGKKIDSIQSSKHRYLEKSRLLADHIAESAMHLVEKKGRVLDKICCGGSSHHHHHHPVVVQPFIVEETAKRDLEVSAASSSAAAVDASVGAGGVSVDAGASSSSASSVDVSAGGGGAASASASSASASEAHVGAGVGASLSAGLESHSSIGIGHKSLGLLGQLSSCEDYERKMIMDMAIEEAAHMIRQLAYETRSEYAYKEDADFERRCLGLAIDLVNKVTVGATGDVNAKEDILEGFRYNNVDDYLKSSIYDAELEADLVSNAGFDYVHPRHRLYDTLDAYDDYVGHASPFSRGRCDSCSRYDLRIGGMCPVCKRSGHKFQGRAKRRQRDVAGDNGRIYHLEQLKEVQNKVNIVNVKPQLLRQA